ncbi:MAG: heme exporter protein CcmB [Thermoflexales bacterium]|nr:heme exporter protein CcmB [Thermoflexales bacterium]
MTFLRTVCAIVAKDLAAELRTREMLGSMLTFSVLVVVVFSFAFQLRASDVRVFAPGMLWVTITFAGALGLGRSLAIEQDKGCLDGLLLAPVDRSAIYFGKLLGNVLFMLAVEVGILPLFVVLFSLPFVQVSILVVVVLGTLGFAGVGTLLSAIAVNTRAREVMLPILLFPVALPVIIAAVKATAGVVDGLPYPQWQPWLGMVVAFDVILIALSMMTFDYIVEE